MAAPSGQTKIYFHINVLEIFFFCLQIKYAYMVNFKLELTFTVPLFFIKLPVSTFTEGSGIQAVTSENEFKPFCS